MQRTLPIPQLSRMALLEQSAARLFHTLTDSAESETRQHAQTLLDRYF
jgi:hypothetical protein